MRVPMYFRALNRGLDDAIQHGGEESLVRLQAILLFVVAAVLYVLFPA